MAGNQKRSVAQKALWADSDYRANIIPALSEAAREYWDKVRNGEIELDREKTRCTTQHSWATTKHDPEAVKRRVAGMLKANEEKKAKAAIKNAPRLCECGCGQMTNPKRKYIAGHGQGHAKRHYTEKSKAAFRESGRRTAESNKITGKGGSGWNTGVPMTEEARQKNSDSHKQRVADGRDTKENLLKRRMDGWEKAYFGGRSGVGTHRGEHGVYHSKKMDKIFRYDSSWELTRMETLEQDGNVSGYWRLPLRLPYVVRGKQHRYYVDFKVQHRDGSITFEEVKPRPLFPYYNNLYKIGVLRKFCKDGSYGCRILTTLSMCQEATLGV